MPALTDDGHRLVRLEPGDDVPLNLGGKLGVRLVHEQVVTNIGDAHVTATISDRHSLADPIPPNHPGTRSRPAPAQPAQSGATPPRRISPASAAVKPQAPR